MLKQVTPYFLTYLLPSLLTYLLTSHNTVLLEKLTGSQLVNKFPTFYGTRRFITAFTSARHLPLSRARPIQSMPPTSHFLKIHLNIILQTYARVFQVVLKTVHLLLILNLYGITFHHLPPLQQPYEQDITRHTLYLWHDNKALARNNCCGATVQLLIISSSAACPALPHLPTLSQKRHDFREKITEHKKVFFIVAPCIL